MSVAVQFPRIHQLSTEVANQIAAGEVIERPASVVKELIENSIDASATQIHIDIARAGIGQIMVHDNGQGVHKEDLKLALMPHATSKLSRFSDLTQIASLGFRGEALPSIASVSRFILTSRMPDTEQAWSIDNSMTLKPAAHAQGTTVDVRDLFHATPARRKFLKSERTEFLHIQALIKAIALSHCATGFRVINDEQPLLNYVACPGDPARRVLDVCGKAFINKSLFVDSERDGMQLWGWLGLNDQARSQSDRQYFFVNGRLVQDRHVNHAIRMAYAERIDRGRFPSYVLYLQVDPAQVDINVHPAKSEVRFAEPRNVHDFIYAGLLSGFAEPQQSFFTDQTPLSDQRQKPEVIHERPAYYRPHPGAPSDFLKGSASLYPSISLSDGKFIIVDVGAEQLLVDVEKTKVVLTAQEILTAYRGDGVAARPILVPLTCGLKQSQLERLGIYTEQVKQWGFDIEQVAPTQVAIRAIPHSLIYADTLLLLKDFLDHLQSSDSDEKIATVLAQHVNDAGVSVADEEIPDLIERIKTYEGENSDIKALPWRRLDSNALTSLLNESR